MSRGPFLKHLKALGIATTLVTHSKLGHDRGKLTELSGDDMGRHLDGELKNNAWRSPDPR